MVSKVSDKTPKTTVQDKENERPGTARFQRLNDQVKSTKKLAKRKRRLIGKQRKFNSKISNRLEALVEVVSAHGSLMAAPAGFGDGGA